MSILNPEIEEGNIEYKRFLINIDESRLEQLSTQMKWRLKEGDNEAKILIYLWKKIKLKLLI